MTNSIDIALQPLDTLLFRDGKPFSASVRAQSGLPNPQTLAGALRTKMLAAIGFDFVKFSRKRRQHSDTPIVTLLQDCGAPEWVLKCKFLGPWLALRKGTEPIEPLLPMPLPLVRDGDSKTWDLGKPTTGVPGWRGTVLSGKTMLPLWRKNLREAKNPGGFLSVEGINAFLLGKTPADQHWFKPDQLFGYDNRTGIGIDMDKLASGDGQIYGISLLSLKEKIHLRPEQENKWKNASVCFAARILPGPGMPENVKETISGPFPFGGEGKYVDCQIGALQQWTEPTIGKQCCYLLTTPGDFATDNDHPSWLPRDLPMASLRSAAIGTPLAVSGWDVARGGPRPTRFVVPPGSVYYLEQDQPISVESFTGNQEGWNFALKGIWNYEQY